MVRTIALLTFGLISLLLNSCSSYQKMICYDKTKVLPANATLRAATVIVDSVVDNRDWPEINFFLDLDSMSIGTALYRFNRGAYKVRLDMSVKDFIKHALQQHFDGASGQDTVHTVVFIDTLEISQSSNGFFDYCTESCTFLFARASIHDTDAFVAKSFLRKNSLMDAADLIEPMLYASISDCGTQFQMHLSEAGHESSSQVDDSSQAKAPLDLPNAPKKLRFHTELGAQTIFLSASSFAHDVYAGTVCSAAGDPSDLFAGLSWRWSPVIYYDGAQNTKEVLVQTLSAVAGLRLYTTYFKLPLYVYADALVPLTNFTLTADSGSRHSDPVNPCMETGLGFSWSKLFRFAAGITNLKIDGSRVSGYGFTYTVRLSLIL